MVAIRTSRCNSQTFYGLAERIYIFCEDIRTNSALFPHVALRDWFFCVMEFTAWSEMSVSI